MLSSLFFLYALLAPPENVCELQGRVKIKDSHATYKVCTTDVNPDLNVNFVHAFPNKPGKWLRVDAHEDFSIQFVENCANADFSIKFPVLFPGC